MLPLKAYDIILGMDWLESFSPMTVHWQQKWLKIQYEDQMVVLQGLAPSSPDQVLVQLCVVSDSNQQLQSSAPTLPAEV